jgi:hypothetical protein
VARHSWRATANDALLIVVSIPLPCSVAPLLRRAVFWEVCFLFGLCLIHISVSKTGRTGRGFRSFPLTFQTFWHVYVLGPVYFVWPWISRAPHVTSRTECNIDVTSGTLTATDTCIGYHVTRLEASLNVIFHTLYVSTRVGAICERGRGTKIKTKANRCGACCYSIMFNVWHVEV